MEGSGWGRHVYLWLIHFDIWQNQYNNVKFKNKIKFKKKIQKKYIDIYDLVYFSIVANPLDPHIGLACTPEKIASNNFFKCKTLGLSIMW